MTRRPPGAGSVTRTPHGTWRVRVRDATGKRRCVGTYADETEARATLRAALERLAAQDLSAVGVVTLRAWGETWLASRDARGDVDRAADALGWTGAALETLLTDHPHWWPREELGPRG